MGGRQLRRSTGTRSSGIVSQDPDLCLGTARFCTGRRHRRGWNLQAPKGIAVGAACGPLRGTGLAVVLSSKGGHSMYWVMIAFMAGLGFYYVTVRRKRKAQTSSKAA